ncbi:atp-dependent clp protease proteolytic subunit : ATP-dependent Clp protease proteolytic subunit OS=Planctomyces brasiliensis (strain ATCC 49424 / DSM 5305 / JCM 21570 / NBRC 103401 / IFAM 1448) GN=clpP PE=3 SV=1: CLP_protease [Gemmata massiliana]|uniref:ATP-dependent Clp protease proteolytic subunit n=1 Tax=Gemmata massiliana TaxID=1210884 RepID=A0A6P2CYD4_9BACT|nr:ATP-dependent Clp protease proteolytic subunit [Gemmata massiliana]VTR92210.1 atp-dependent clp protease proteolytic subunit : ATP-dependent Clp protease proteolytic subunit OS=Planctomyces brasiliensis (strain ATCC 49424 / DSM 5305 / JCM 21570 / NBRC 103401 / IFAM 1448) GN=clpP PE=3 SV=1: CLP_protease [Gemmata massiliana]
MFSPFEPMAAARTFEPTLQRGQTSRQRTVGIADLLMDNRIIFLGAGQDLGSPVITDLMASFVIQRLLFLQYENKTADIHMYINSPGGSVSATLAIYDTMQFIEAPIHTYCMGLAASGAAVLLAAGSKGKRYALPNSKVMIHQPYGQVGGQVSDIEIQANEIIKERQRLNEILAKHTGQPLEVIAKETDRDKYYHADEAKAFGLVDEVLSRPEPKK